MSPEWVGTLFVGPWFFSADRFPEGPPNHTLIPPFPHRMYGDKKSDNCAPHHVSRSPG